MAGVNRGGSQPVWSRKGDELFYRSDAMMSVRITPGVSFIPSTPERLFDDRGYTKGAGHTGYDNWFDELKERLQRSDARSRHQTRSPDLDPLRARGLARRGCAKARERSRIRPVASDVHRE